VRGRTEKSPLLWGWSENNDEKEAQLLPLVRAGVKFADGLRVDPAKPVIQSTDNQPREAA